MQSADTTNTTCPGDSGADRGAGGQKQKKGDSVTQDPERQRYDDQTFFTDHFSWKYVYSIFGPDYEFRGFLTD